VNLRTDLMRAMLATGVACGALSTLAVPSDVDAIPAFARKYGFSCSTCHAPVPRLKAYGDEFAGNGFQLPDDQEPIRAFRDVGDELLLLQRELPIAVRLDAYFAQGVGDAEFSDLQSPWGLKLLSGGNVAKDVGYYFYFYMSERGEVAGVEDAYLHFNNIGGSSFDIMAGQFQISDPLLKRELRLTYEDYQLYKVTPGASTTNLTYDRGLMLVYDLPFGVGLVGQIVNGNGKDEAGDDRLFDIDKDKGYSLRASYELGPLGIGGFWYGTREMVTDDPAGPPPPVTFANKVEVVGPDISLSLLEGGFTISGQYLRRIDTNPAVGVLDLTTDGYIAEAVWLPKGENGRSALTLLYNMIDSDDPALDYETATVAGSWLMARNLRLLAELTRDMQTDDMRVIVGFVSGF